MKKILAVLVLFILFGCDDGDMTFQSFNFADATARTCEDGKIYKISGAEALVLDLDPAYFENVPTNGVPRVITISGTNTVQYLKYGTEIGNNQNIICSSLPPVSPTEVWNANGGTIEVTTVANTDPENLSIITGYTHTIRLVSLSFTRNEETIIIQNNNFGDIETELGYNFSFDENVTLQACTGGEVLYIIKQNEVLRMQLNNAALFINSVEGSPREQDINEDNSIFLDIYDGNNITAQRVCGAEEPTPHLIGRWRAIEGKVRVTTTEITTGVFSHQIEFINMTFQNTANADEEFVRTNYILGDTYDQ